MNKDACDCTGTSQITVRTKQYFTPDAQPDFGFVVAQREDRRGSGVNESVDKVSGHVAI